MHIIMTWFLNNNNYDYIYVKYIILFESNFLTVFVLFCIIILSFVLHTFN